MPFLDWIEERCVVAPWDQIRSNLPHQKKKFFLLVWGFFVFCLWFWSLGGSQRYRLALAENGAEGEQELLNGVNLVIQLLPLSVLGGHLVMRAGLALVDGILARLEACAQNAEAVERLLLEGVLVLLLSHRGGAHQSRPCGRRAKALTRGESVEARQSRTKALSRGEGVEARQSGLRAGPEARPEARARSARAHAQNQRVLGGRQSGQRPRGGGGRALCPCAHVIHAGGTRAGARVHEGAQLATAVIAMRQRHIGQRGEGLRGSKRRHFVCWIAEERCAFSSLGRKFNFTLKLNALFQLWHTLKFNFQLRLNSGLFDPSDPIQFQSKIE